MAKTRQRDGESIAFEENDDGDLELVQGSMRKLKLVDGDLLVVRVAVDDGEILARVRDTVAALLEDHEADVKLLIVPFNMELEQIPRGTAAELLRGIVEGG